MSPVEAEIPTEGPVPSGRIWKASVFTAAVCGGCFVGCAIWQYESHRRKTPFDYFRERGVADFGLNRQKKAGPFREQLNAWWMGLSPGERAFIPICAANVLVWCAWRVPALRPMMVRYFTSSPTSPSVLAPMILSTFSHYSFLHLFVNMYVLHSFSNGEFAIILAVLALSW
jgi:rhomboid-like protein